MVDTHLTATMDLHNYCLQIPFEEFNGHMPEKIAKLVNLMDVQMKSASFKPLDPVSLLLSRHSFKNACNSNSIGKGAEIWLLALFSGSHQGKSVIFCACKQQDGPTQRRQANYVLSNG